MNKSQQQIHICKSYKIKQVLNTKASQYHIAATPHYRGTFCSYSYILVVHFTASI